MPARNIPSHYGFALCIFPRHNLEAVSDREKEDRRREEDANVMVG